MESSPSIEDFNPYLRIVLISHDPSPPGIGDETMKHFLTFLFQYYNQDIVNTSTCAVCKEHFIQTTIAVESAMLV